ncbi:MAG: hypothetical protein QM817_21210 [Archangium sp.]
MAIAPPTSIVEPLMSAAPTMTDPVNGTRVWLFDDAATIVDQTMGSLTTSVARYLTVSVESVMQQRWISAGKKVTFIHDWRRTRDYESEARTMLIKWGRDSLKHARQVWVHIAPDSSPFIRIAVSTAIGALKIARMPIDTAPDLAPLLKPLIAIKPVVLG